MIFAVPSIESAYITPRDTRRNPRQGIHNHRRRVGLVLGFLR